MGFDPRVSELLATGVATAASIGIRGTIICNCCWPHGLLAGCFWSEGLIAGLAVVGAIVSLGRKCDAAESEHASVLAFGRFLAFYTLLLIVLYSAIPYKTPWCMLSFLHAMTLLAGIGAWALLRWTPRLWGKAIIATLLVAGVVQLGWQCYAVNFRFAADARNPYAYAQTSTDAVNLATRMERLARLSTDGHDMAIHVVTPENYWPLPWYLRQFNCVGYWQDTAAWRTETAGGEPPSIILLTPDVQAEVDAGLRATYNTQAIHGLRPGVFVMVYVRDDLWQKFIAPRPR